VSGPLIKLCGLRDTGDMRAAVRAGADLVGIVLVPGARRFVPTPTAIAMAVAARELAAELGRFAPEVVGVVGGDIRPETIVRLTDAIGLDRVQLVGSEEFALAAADALGARPIVRAVAAHEDADVLDLERTCVMWEARGARVLIDAGAVNGIAGGTGTRVPGALVARLVPGTQRGLAGGLDPDNIGGIVRAHRPALVDVSSGIERDGAKDPERMRSFIAAARAALLDAVPTAERALDDTSHAARTPLP